MQSLESRSWWWTSSVAGGERVNQRYKNLYMVTDHVMYNMGSKSNRRRGLPLVLMIDHPSFGRAACKWLLHPALNKDVVCLSPSITGVSNNGRQRLYVLNISHPREEAYSPSWPNRLS